MSSSYSGLNRRKSSDTDSYFNAQFGALPSVVETGEALWSSSRDEMLVASVGGGITTSIYDRELKMGALAYTLLPDAMLDAFPYFDKVDPQIVEKAIAPLERAIAMMKEHGAGKNRILIRLMGGANLENAPKDMGTKNAVFIREYLSRKGLKIQNEDLDGPYIRRVHFFPMTGQAVRKILKRQDDYSSLYEVEQWYQKNIASGL